MSRISLSLLVTVLILFGNGCKKDPPLLKVLDEVTFSCQEQVSDFFFEGFINGEKVCFHAGYDDYEMYFRKTTGITTGPTFNPDDPGSSNNGATWGTFSIQPTNPKGFKHLDQLFQIETPKFEIGAGLDTIIPVTIKEGDLQIIDEAERKNSFNLKFVIVSKIGFEDKPGVQWLSLQSYGGNQEGSFLRVTELETEEFGNKLNYTVTFEFECNLYIAGSEDDKYGRLEDGILRMAFSIDK
jgi:hypothetical protein